MGLFQLRDNKVIIDVAALPIPEFKLLWDRDPSKGKETAYRDLSYVYFMADFNSPYSIMPADKRKQMIIDDFIKDSTWKPDEDIENAISKYILLSEGTLMRYLKNVQSTIDKVGEFIRDKEIDEKALTPIINTISKTSALISSYSKLDEAARKESVESTKTRGNKDVGSFER